MSRSDRVAKYNQLIRIEEALGDKAPFNGLKEVKGRRNRLRMWLNGHIA